MEIYLIIAVIAILVMTVLGYFVGNRGKKGLIDSVIKLTAERDVQRTNVENLTKQIETQKASYEAQMNERKDAFDSQMQELKATFAQQLQQEKTAHEGQIAALKEMNEKQMQSQLELIKEQMQTTSEKVLKQRQAELGEENKEQVSKIIDPLQKSLKDMQEALDKTKEQQTEALTRLDETIKINMQKSAEIGETADRLTRALTGEVKIQGNFGELKLKQLLEGLELKEGEQFDTQETLRDKAGKGAKGDDGKGINPRAVARSFVMALFV